MKGNKLFVKSMIITAVLGLITLMITMFIGIRWVLDKEPVGNAQVGQEQTGLPNPQTSQDVLGVIKELNGDTLIVFNIEKKQGVQVKIQDTTQVKDAYDKPMPKENLREGDIVKLGYDQKSGKLVSVSHSIQAWTKTDMKNVKLDRPNKVMAIGDNIYKYTDNTVVLDKEGNNISIYQVGDQDILEMKGIDNQVHSMRILEEQGYLQLEGTPIQEGVLEIDINRQIPIASVVEPIPVSVGQHKVTIQLPGYEVMTEMIDVVAGKTIILSLQDLQKAYTTLSVSVQNAGLHYTVQIDGTLYGKDEVIQLPMGTHTVEVQAEGYMPWTQQVVLTEPMMELQVQLQPLAVVPEEEGTSEGTNAQAVEGYKVNITTEPGDAKVYIDGESKGKTPYSTTLPLGEYRVILEKEGYEPYETSIILDNGDAQNSYLYMLIPKINE
ncbi:MAG: PEGA domain-containing protein [Cellulosilyticaceae bacterium]